MRGKRLKETVSESEIRLEKQGKIITGKQKIVSEMEGGSYRKVKMVTEIKYKQRNGESVKEKVEQRLQKVENGLK